MIDVVLSGDNAIVIWMATKKLPWKERKKAILFWVLGATILRIVLAFFAVYLMKIIGIQVAWAFLLLYVVWKFYIELRAWGHDNSDEKDKTVDWLLNAIKLIIIADVSMSLDNVLAVAWAAKENILALWLGLVVSIFLMAFASNYIARKMEQYPQIQWVGLLIILLVSIEMLLTWFEKIDQTLQIQSVNFIGILFFIMFLFVYKKMKHLSLPDVHFMQKWKHSRSLFLSFWILISTLSVLSLFHIIDIPGNLAVIYTLFIVTVILEIEYLWTLRKRKS